MQLRARKCMAPFRCMERDVQTLSRKQPSKTEPTEFRIRNAGTKCGSLLVWFGATPSQLGGAHA